MIGLPYGEKNYDVMLSRFHMVPERNGRTDLLYQYRASVCWRAIKTVKRECLRRSNKGNQPC